MAPPAQESSGRGWMNAPAIEGSDAMHRVLDAPFLELLWDFPPDQGSNLLPSFTVRYYRGLTGDRPAWILPYLCEQGQFGMQAPAAECDLRNMTVITNGCLAAQGMWQQSNEATLSREGRVEILRVPVSHVSVGGGHDLRIVGWIPPRPVFPKTRKAHAGLLRNTYPDRGESGSIL